MSSPFHTVAILPIKAGKTEEFLAATRTMAKAAEENEPDTLKYYFILTKNEQGQDQLVAVEKYVDEAASKRHTETAHFAAFFGKIGEWLDGAPQIHTGGVVAGYERA
ncbi:hypothetical protein BDV18DRAFT_147477, partial [Aspergillus unguis]